VRSEHVDVGSTLRGTTHAYMLPSRIFISSEVPYP